MIPLHLPIKCSYSAEGSDEVVNGMKIERKRRVVIESGDGRAKYTD